MQHDIMHRLSDIFKNHGLVCVFLFACFVFWWGSEVRLSGGIHFKEITEEIQD